MKVMDKFKRYTSLLLNIIIICGLLSGCKIETPNDVARDVLTRSYSSSKELTQSSGESKGITENQSSSNKQTKDKPQSGGKSSSSKSSSNNYMGIDEAKVNKKNYSKYENETSENEKSSSDSSHTVGSGNTGGWNHDNDRKNLEFVDKDGNGVDDSTGLDKYLTDPIPAGKPHPLEPENVKVDKSKIEYCTLSIRCDTILNNRKKLDKELWYLLDQDGIKDGVIYKQREVGFYKGESVFDVLLRETKAERIHMEFSFTPMYNSHYIEGINNFYEFSCGDLSGWMYKVNGWFPNYGCSRYQLKDGDVVNWVYTCDLGRDVGCEWMGGKK